ncbi:hypothetical protein CBR_g55047 [Chara braunii]|uniref:BTB domain-containing protein n=1 Tax=Chara braunii TaxID=69332 RepID=A0A388MCI5_CHABU|nr:hypothetical protein CBR_g55047 [Chara braunii]|eukprot:GBG92278.1 hypothetical protein CBR_g55047 [Chara braunii]
MEWKKAGSLRAKKAKTGDNWYSLRIEEKTRPEGKQGQELLLAVQAMLTRPELLDLTFVCEESKEVRANRALLASRNEFFSKLLYGSMREGSMDRIPLPTVKARSPQVVINYLHGCPFSRTHEMSWEDVVDMYQVAEQYQVSSLCESIVFSISTGVQSGAEIGALLNVAVGRHAEKLLKAAENLVIYDAVVFDSKFFRGWKKESIVHFLKNAQFPPHVTETLIAEALLAAASNDRNIVKQEKAHVTKVEYTHTSSVMAMITEEPPAIRGDAGKVICVMDEWDQEPNILRVLERRISVTVMLIETEEQHLSCRGTTWRRSSKATSTFLSSNPHLWRRGSNRCTSYAQRYSLPCTGFTRPASPEEFHPACSSKRPGVPCLPKSRS